MKVKISPGYVRAVTDPEIRRIILVNMAYEASNKLRICEQLRFMYDTVDQLPDGELKTLLVDQLIDAFSMGKKMNSRLTYYKKKYKDTTGHSGKNIILLYDTRRRKRMRSTRVI